MPRVTEVLDHLMEPELFKWHIRLGKAACKKISDEALRVGSAVDALVQQDIKEGGYLVPEGDQSIENCMRAWELFKKDYPLFVDSVKEMQTEVKQGDVVGHPDFIHVDGITDLKCSSGIRPKYWTQTAQYGHMKFKVSDFNFIAILRLDKVTGLYEYRKIEDWDYIFYEIGVFNAYLTAFQHASKNREMLRQQLENEVL